MSWIENVKKNIFPLSVEKYSLTKALEEWYFDYMEDNIEANETCKLCDHYPIRYKFFVSNDITKEKLYVGSECILRFEDEGYRLKDKNGNFVSNDTLNNAKNRALKSILLKYLENIDNLDMSIVLDIVNDDKKLSPNMIPMFYYPYKKADEDMKKVMLKYIKVNLREKRNKQQLQDFINNNNWRAEFIRNFMTSSQIKRFF